MSGTPSNPLNPFENAPILVREIKDHVTTQQLGAIERAKALQDAAKTAVENLAHAMPRLNLSGVTPPQAPKFPAPVAQNLHLPELGSSSFGAVMPMARERFAVRPVAPVPGIEVDGFQPVFDQLQIPDAPEPRPEPVFPVAPVGRDIALPDKPVLNRPGMPDLVELVIPAFRFAPLPPWSDENPEFVGSSVSAVLQWHETPYVPVLMDEQVAVIRRMWAGGTGLPPAVEQALWERAASREDIAIARDVSAAAVEFSGRGYTLPPGALVARIDAVRAEGALRKQGLGRDILAKVTDTHIENLRYACTQALAAESVLVGLWGQMAQRALESAKYQMDAELAVLNANIAIYNARQGARQNSANVRRLALEERAQEIQTMRLELDAELAKGQINEQRVRVFSELYRALQADVDLYKAEMGGAQIESELQRNEVERFKAAVQATAELVQADKLRYDAYESRVKGETAKAGLLESQARAYSAYVSGKSTVAEIAIKNQRAGLDLQDLELRAFIAGLESDKAVLQAQVAAITANAEAHKTNTARFVAQAQAETAIAEVDQRAWDSQVRNSIALYEAEMRKVIADMEQMIRVAGLQADILKSIAQAESTLAAGAMAGITLGSTIGATAGTSATADSKVTQNM